ncbi:YciI family protein [Lactiplantibacillus carotarum]|uniref:YciI family protein n=1 Tax=Lactiplantibacillus carotarum TaxID=2993456 RepID=UPI00298EED9B|nr:hypothetical protein [Lactiplantibacillus carotarum]
MFLLNISINESEQSPLVEKHFTEHQAWIRRNFKAGHFLLLGPSQTYQRTGVIIAQAENQQALQELLAEDTYYPDLATYKIEAFTPALISPTITDFQAKP